MPADLELVSAIVRTLNARYHTAAYGLARGNANTTYPVSAFITHIVYLRGALVSVDVPHITVSRLLRNVRSMTHGSWHLLQTLGVRCVEVESSVGSEGVPQFDAACVQVAIQRILSEESAA